MSRPPIEPAAKKWRRRCFIVSGLWLLSFTIGSFSETRALVSLPLYVHHSQAQGEMAYVMADGAAYWERLRAASDLYHWGRVKRIVILKEEESAGHNFVHQKSEAKYQWAIEFLAVYGVPEDRISMIPQTESALFGSLSEARTVAKTFPAVNSIVVVTSAPHTRRSLMCFERSFSKETQVSCYSASELDKSDELQSPIWMEYVKLVVYYFAA